MAKARKSKSRSLVSGTKGLADPAGAGRLLDDLRRLIDETRQQVARTVNSAMVGLYWQIGKRVREDILHEQRAVSFFARRRGVLGYMLLLPRPWNCATIEWNRIAVALRPGDVM